MNRRYIKRHSSPCSNVRRNRIPIATWILMRSPFNLSPINLVFSLLYVMSQLQGRVMIYLSFEHPQTKTSIYKHSLIVVRQKKINNNNCFDTYVRDKRLITHPLTIPLRIRLADGSMSMAKFGVNVDFNIGALKITQEFIVTRLSGKHQFILGYEF